ncbi:MAG: VanZ family protein [Bacteroidales bacterium]|nr:VanZ family protein [Bacteroidales bacterium]
MKSNRTRSIVFSIAMVIYIGAVAYLCFANFQKMHDVPRFFLGIPIDKVVHFAMFFPFPALAYLAYDRATDTPLKAFGALISICAIGCVFAGVTEIIQGSLPYRSQDIKDFGADCLAIGISSILTFLIDLSKMRKRSWPARSTHSSRY